MNRVTMLVLLCWFSFLAVGSLADDTTKGFVLKVGEGEFAAGTLIKASPKTGTRGALLLQQSFPERFSTGIHYHIEADEIFYILGGTGYAKFGGTDHPVGAGDVIFIPAGEDHKLFTKGTRMELLEFLDKPGLAEEFRAWHRTYGEALPASLEQLNEIATKYGTIYKTLE